LLASGCSDPGLAKRVKALEERNKAVEAKLNEVVVSSNGAHSLLGLMSIEIRVTDLSLRTELHKLGLNISPGPAHHNSGEPLHLEPLAPPLDSTR
jgi:hypothetical protein